MLKVGAMLRARVVWSVGVAVFLLGANAASGTQSQEKDGVLDGVRRPGGIGMLFAVSRSTGELVSGFPRVQVSAAEFNSEAGIFAIADDGAGGWYVGGNFRSIGGVACPNLAHVRRDRTVDPEWCPRPDDWVWALLRVGSTLYVAGDVMTRIAGEPRNSLAAFNTATGQLTQWNPRALGGGVFDLATNASGSVVYIDGQFNRVGGTRRYNFAALDAYSGRATSFTPNPDANSHGDSIEWFAVTATRIYATGEFTHIGGQAAPAGIAALDPRSGRQIPWTATSNGLWNGTVVAGDTVFVSGYFTRFNGTARKGAAAVDAATGALRQWAPVTRASVIDISGWGHELAAWLSDGEFAALDETTGRVLWSSRRRLHLGGQETVPVLAASGDTIVIGWHG